MPSALRERELFQTTPFFVLDAAPHLPSENADASTKDEPPNDEMATSDVNCAAAVTSTGAKKSVRELRGVFEAAKQQTTIPGNAADGAQRAMKAVVFADGTAAVVGDGQGALRASARPVAKHVAKKEEEEGEEEKTTTTTTNRPLESPRTASSEEGVPGGAQAAADEEPTSAAPNDFQKFLASFEKGAAKEPAEPVDQIQKKEEKENRLLESEREVPSEDFVPVFVQEDAPAAPLSKLAAFELEVPAEPVRLPPAAKDVAASPAPTKKSKLAEFLAAFAKDTPPRRAGPVEKPKKRSRVADFVRAFPADFDPKA